VSTTTPIAFALFALIVPHLFGHGWSDEMRHELNTPAPDWLVVGTSIKVHSAKQATPDESVYRPISGDSQSTRDRVTIPSRGIEIKVDFPIDWYRGSSLSPDGIKLVINSGMKSSVLEIRPDGSYRDVKLRLPHVTYDAGFKGFITGWSWIDNNTLIGEAGIDTEEGEFIESRFYIFYVKEGVLSRLDLSGLGLPTTEGLTVTKVAADLTGFKLSLGDASFAVKADLKSVPQPAENQTDRNRGTVSVQENRAALKKSPELKPASPPSEEPISSTPWSVIAVLIVAASGLLWLLLKQRL
jgi:hypothetical protein